MSTEAVFLSALPLGALSAFATYKLIPFKPSSMVGKVSIGIMGLLGYTMGRVYYSIVCLEKHAPSVAEMIRNKKGFDRRYYLFFVIILFYILSLERSCKTGV